MLKHKRDMTKDKYPLYRERLQVNKKKQTFQLRKGAARRGNTNDHKTGTDR